MSRDENMCWFHGKLTREEAEDLIKQAGTKDGTFLVRESHSATGDFVLTLLHKDEVCQYQIRRHGEDAFFSIDDKVKILHGLDTLIEFYQQAPNGLPTKLTAHIKKDPPPNHTRSHGVTNLLHRATKEHNQTVVSELLKCGYRNLDAKNQDGQTAVHLAALYCDVAILELLLDAGVNVNCMDTSGNMPLHYACRSQPASFIRVLINANANVQGRNIQNGYVPLHEAAKHGNLDAVRELLAAHAPLLPRTTSGEFPIDLAKETGQESVVEFLNNYKTPPANTFKSQWYHGTLQREEAKEALMQFASDMRKSQSAVPVVDDPGEGVKTAEASVDDEVNTAGCFLVRFSERETCYVLTLLWDNNVKNFIISQAVSSFCLPAKQSHYLHIEDGPYLPSLEHLVEHFMRFADGLPVSLKYPVRPKPKPPLPLCSTMPRSSHKKTYTQSLPPSTAAAEDRNAHIGEDQQRKHSLDAHALGLDEKRSHTISPKKKQKEIPSSVFNTLRLGLVSPKKSSIISTLRRNKIKSKTPPCDENNPKSPEEEIAKAGSLLKDLSFSTDFASLQESIPAPMTDGFYNVPKNNAAVVANDGACALPSIEIESKTEEEVEYFTKSDVAIERDRCTGALQEFGNCPPKFLPNANGYIPTVDIRVFNDHFSMTDEAQEASAAELREFAQHTDRLDSILSTASSDSYILRYLNRQTSNTSTITQTSEVLAQTKHNYLIPQDCLKLESIIGEGEFGSVYKGSLIRRFSETSPELRIEVAIKTLRDEHTNKTEFLREASVMIRLQHHCIVQLIGISKGKTLMMVQEIVPLGSMLHFILDNKAKINPNYELKLWASQIACGMQYLESHHFVHRDLAARNILLASLNQAKISDFGLSRALGTGSDCYQASQGGKWPIKWYAPESFNNGLFSHASDVWSFGVTLWEMFSLGEPPYGDVRGVEAIQLIESGHRLSQPAICPHNVYEIMINCWNYKPKDRPTFQYLTEFFAKDPDYQNIIELIKSEHIS